ncbi:MAG: SpoIIE family protein phosphatase [Bacteroidetes bacterium]|nr:SpoIIE family protein phosphatase [Bacteroidota bacterium]
MRFVVVFIFIVSAFSGVAHAAAVMNLQAIDFARQKTVILNGNWEFYWNKFYYPADFKAADAPQPDLLTAPVSWNDLKVDGKPCGSYGYATYRLKLVNCPKQQLMLNAYSVQTSLRIFLNDSLVDEVGQVGTDAASCKPMNRDIQVLFPANASEVEIVLHIANFHHRKGGFVQPFELGDPETIITNQSRYYILDALESAALAIIGFFLLALYIFRRKDLSVLYFSLFSITLSLRPVISVNYLLANLFPDISWSLMLKLEYLGVLFPCLFMVLFIRKLFPAQMSLIVVRILIVVFVVKIAITVFFTPAVFSWLVLALLVLIPLGVLLMTVVIIRAVIAKIDGANYAGIGVIVLFVSLVLKVMTYAGILPAMNAVITLLDIGFIFMMSLILGSRFSMQFVKVETLQTETEKQRFDIEQKKQQIEHQKELVEEKNKEILDSINYAKRIQAAILPPGRLMHERLPQHFIFYKPKDIVAGDFYWMEEKNGHVLFAVADCTGHGVPGSLVSVICNNGLNRSVREHGLTDPAEILDKTREIIIAEFEKSDEEVKDGMDISLISMQHNPSQQKINVRWAGANNPVWILRKGADQIEELKPDKQPIGKFANAVSFTTHSTELYKGDCIYLFTDGFADQFGGEKGKKYKYARLKELLVHIAEEPMEKQAGILDQELNRWKDVLEQTDDICIAGIKM